MRRIFTIILSLIIRIALLANPIAIPTIEISELYFESPENWILELVYYEVDPEGIPLDSIYLISSTDTVKLPNYDLMGTTGFFIITKDSLDSHFNLNNQGDTLIVKSFMMGDFYDDILIYGNFNEAVISMPYSNQSICDVLWFFSKDNSPTLGEQNDSTGMCGTLKGTVYDINNNPVENMTFIIDFAFETLSDGSFSARVYSTQRKVNHLCYYYGAGKRYCPRIDEINYVMEPDSVIYRNIFLMDSLIPVETNIRNIPREDFIFRFFPNPVVKSNKINFEIDLPINTTILRLEIINIEGKLLKVMRISETAGEIELPIRKGILLLNLWLDSFLLSTDRIIIKND